MINPSEAELPAPASAAAREFPGRTPTSAATTVICAILFFFAIQPAAADGDPVSADVVIYGGTPSGVAAAVTAAGDGNRVVLLEPYRWVGGLITNGLSHADFRTFEGINGAYLELTRRVREYYSAEYGADSPQARGNFRGTHAEPKVNRVVFEKWLSEFPSIAVITRTRLLAVATSDDRRRIDNIIVVGPRGERRTIRGSVFVDATYEGDLMAAAGCEYRAGREAKSDHGESLAAAVADKQVQGYNFRMIVTSDPDDRVLPEKPDGYRREDFLPLLELIQDGRIDKPFCYSSGDSKAVFKAQNPPLPNRKYDVNDVSHGSARLSLPQINDRWPDGDPAERERIFAEQKRHQLGLFYFVQNDPALPAEFREQALRFGFARDEFVETNYFPDQLYVREARRLVGRYVFSEKDVACSAGTNRAVLHRDAIATGDYGPNCHGTAHAGPRIGGRHTGEFYKRCPPYQIPYSVLLPKEMENLLVSVAVSSTHVGFCALRLEPIWMSLGQAAGLAARESLRGGIPLPDLDIAALQSNLHQLGAATIYLADVPPGSRDYRAVQWWGTWGGLHDLPALDVACGERGSNITGQYYRAFPGHEVRLEQEIDRRLFDRWSQRLVDMRLEKISFSDQLKRGDFIRQAFEQFSGRFNSNQ